MSPVTARPIDGKAQAGRVKADLARRVAGLRGRGIVPGLATILVGEDPASRVYVAGKHRDCAEVGIASQRIDLPGDIAAADLARAIERLNQDPACTGFIVQLPLPGHLDPAWALSLVDPDKDADGLHPVNLGRLVLGMPAPRPATPAASTSCWAATRSTWTARKSASSGAAPRGGARWACC
jgi:methylenetetrahydrofolate dehydrogenase (NADP+)/methenyltetrahydrofolate cyclohydrolase